MNSATAWITTAMAKQMRILTSVVRVAVSASAVMSGYLGPNKLIGSPEPFYAHLEANPHPDDQYSGEIVSVSVTGRTACARLVEDNLYGLSFVNDFHLINEDGSWSIVSKLFHHD